MVTEDRRTTVVQTPSLGGVRERVTRFPEMTTIPDSGIIQAVVDSDYALNYEVRRWPYLLAWPVMWLLILWVFCKKKLYGLFGQKPKVNTIWFDGLSGKNMAIKRNAKTCHALDVIYNHHNLWHDPLGNYWINMVNAQAVRNRKKIVVRELVKAMRNAYCNDGHIRLLSIASGSAQAVFEALKVIFDSYPEITDIKAVFLDSDNSALEKSRQLAKDFNFTGVFFYSGNGALPVLYDDLFSYIQGDAFRFAEAVEVLEGQPNIIEMVGLTDYLNSRLATTLFKKIYRTLASGGTFLSGNICPNFERHFMKWVIDWNEMIYRTPQEMSRVLADTDIPSSQMQIFLEPQCLHMVTKILKPRDS